MDIPKTLAAYEMYGCEFTKEAGEHELVGECPFCEKVGHFYANRDTALWSCKKCGMSGNRITFLTEIWKMHLEQTTDKHYDELSKNRKLPSRCFRRFQVATDGEFWLIPHQNERGLIHDIRRWKSSFKGPMSTPGGKTLLFGLPRFRDTKKSAHVWLCEGEWDVMAMSELVKRARHLGDIVVGVPGADTLKKEWLEFFERRNVHLCYDHDAAGSRGSTKAGKMLRDVAKSVDYLHWPDECPDGYDIRDYVTDSFRKGTSAKDAFKRLLKLFKAEPLEQEDDDEEGSEKREFIVSRHRPSFKKLVSKLRESAQVDGEMEQCLRVCLATAFTEQMPNDPVWMYIVGPPGSGKTMILSAMKYSDRVFYRSTITPHALVSGFSAGRGHQDPSLLPKMNGLCAVFKDGTEILSLPKPVFVEVNSVLRGAYDGEHHRTFGNGVTRAYTDLHFSMLIGVTPAIYAVNESSMGDRFLKWSHIREGGMRSERDRVDMALDAIENSGMKTRELEEFGEMVAEFLAVNVEEFPPLPEHAASRIASMAMMVGRLRTAVERDFRENVVYEPQPEYGTRLAQQLGKLYKGLLLADPAHPAIAWAVVQRVALDTCSPRVLRLFKAIVGRPASTSRELAVQLGIGGTMMDRWLEDLRIVGIAKRTAVRKVGKTVASEHSITEEMRKLWQRARFDKAI